MSDDSDFMQRWPGLEGTWPPIRFPTIEEAEEFENDLRAEIKRLRARGNSYAEISRATGVSVFKVTRLAKIDEEERESRCLPTSSVRDGPAPSRAVPTVFPSTQDSPANRTHAHALIFAHCDG